MPETGISNWASWQVHGAPLPIFTSAASSGFSSNTFVAARPPQQHTLPCHNPHFHPWINQTTRNIMVCGMNGVWGQVSQWVSQINWPQSRGSGGLVCFYFLPILQSYFFLPLLMSQTASWTLMVARICSSSSLFLFH